MNARLLIPFVAATLFSVSAHALDCSGGANGGMDATGNQCNDAATVAATASSDTERFPSARLPKREPNQVESLHKTAAKPTAATRNISKSSGIKPS